MPVSSTKAYITTTDLDHVHIRKVAKPRHLARGVAHHFWHSHRTIWFSKIQDPAISCHDGSPAIHRLIQREGRFYPHIEGQCLLIRYTRYGENFRCHPWEMDRV